MSGQKVVVGDKGRSVCAECGLTNVTYEKRDVPICGGQKMVENILAGVCDDCGMVVCIPGQESPKIKAALES